MAMGHRRLQMSVVQAAVAMLVLVPGCTDDELPPATVPAASEVGDASVVSSTVQGSPRPLTSDPALASTHWKVETLTDPKGVLHLPYDGGQAPTPEAHPSVTYDPNGRARQIMDGLSGSSPSPFSEELDISLFRTFDEVNPFPRTGRFFLANLLGRGEPTLQDGILKLEFLGWVATLRLAQPPPDSPVSTQPRYPPINR